MLAELAMANAIKALMSERTRQLRKWGRQRHPDVVYHTIDAEELGEWASAIKDGKRGNIAEECIQTAAVALGAYESVIDSPQVSLSDLDRAWLDIGEKYGEVARAVASSYLGGEGAVNVSKSLADLSKSVNEMWIMVKDGKTFHDYSTPMSNQDKVG